MASKPKQTGRAKSTKPSSSVDMDKLRKQIKLLQTEVQLLRNNFDRSKIPAEFIQTEDMTAMYQETYTKMVEELNKLKEGKGVSADQQDLEEKLRKVKQDLSESEKKRKSAEEEAYVTNKRLVLLEDENKKLKDSTELIKPSSRKGNNDLSTTLQETTTENDKVNKKLIGLREANADLEKKLSFLQDSSKVTDQNAVELQKLTAELALKSSELHEWQNRNTELQEKVDEQSKQLEAEARKYEEEKKEKRELQTRLSILSEANTGKDNNKDALLKQLDEVKRDQDNEIKLLQKELNSKMGLEEAVNKMKQELSDKKDLEETVDKLTKEKSNLNEMIETLKCETAGLHSRIQDLEIAAKSSNTAGSDEDSSRLRTMIQELQKELETVKGERDTAKMQVKQHKNDLHEAFVQIEKKEKEMKSSEAKHKELIERKEQTINKLRRESSMVDPTSGKSTQNGTELMKQIQTLKEENEALHNRVSQLAGAKLQDSNPGITNLSDDNRPTKVGEKFAELYDNEWTEAFEEQEETTGDEKGTIEYLYKLLLDIYSFCQSQSRKHAESLQRICTTFSGTSANNSKIQEIHLVQKKLLKDVLKSFASFQVTDVVQNFFDSNKSLSRSASRTTDFIKKAVEICWYMALQDPQMIIDKSVKPADSFDTDMFKVYTKKGEKVDYIVWPPLLLHKDGPLVGKGVAQGK